MKQTFSRIKPVSTMRPQRISDNIGDHQAAHNDDNYNRLTACEREIFHLTVLGLSSTQVACRLLISPRTVETHRENIMKKLGMRNKVELVCWAFRHGWVDVETEVRDDKS